MRVSVWILFFMLSLFQTGCFSGGYIEKVPEQEIKGVMPGSISGYYTDEEDFELYVDKINADLYFLFSYTRALNKLAKSRGVEPSFYRPICEFVEWGKLRDPPDFKFTKNISSLEKMNDELVEYIRLTKELYKLQAEEFKNLEQVARELCTY